MFPLNVRSRVSQHYKQTVLLSNIQRINGCILESRKMGKALKRYDKFRMTGPL